jgi:DNA-binding NarL/FixJ family response regulator
MAFNQPPADPATEQANARQRRVLLVEDEVLVRQLMRMALATALPAAEIREAGRVCDAAAVAATWCADWVMLDMRLPDGLGLELVPSLRHAQPNCIIMAVTGMRDIAVVRMALDAGINGFVCKDEDFATWTAAITHLLAGHVYYSPHTLSLLMDRPVASGLGSKLNALTPRERDVVALAGRGWSVRQTATHLQISEQTVKIHRHHAMRKLELKGTPALVRCAIALGLATPQ